MERIVCKWLLLWGLLLLLSFEGMAQDSLPFMGCRRGVLPAQRASRRAGRQEGKEEIDVTLYRGDRRQLVVLASFADRPIEGTESAALVQWEKIFNQKHFDEAPYVGSVHDYFYDQSYGQFRLKFDLQYVEVGLVSTYQSTQIDDENSQYLVDDVMDVLLSRDIDWSLYDWDDDGEVEQLLIVYAGMGMADGGGANSIWPHQWWLSKHRDMTQDGFPYREACTFVHDGKAYKVDCYCAVPELGKVCYSFGVLCHEYSHCLGFPDFYSSTGHVLGEWDVMDYGYYTGGGCCPVSYSAHERMLMGWLTPIELTGPVSVTDMPALSDEPQAYIIHNDGYPDEFYVVENRQHKGWDASLPASGLLVFHVDFDPLYWFSPSECPNRSSVKRYEIVPANGKKSTSYKEGWVYPYGNNNELTNTSTPAAVLTNPNNDGSLLMNKPLTNMTVTDGLAAFDFMDGATGVEGIESLRRFLDAEQSSGWYTLSGMLLSERPTQQGLYIHNGKKELVK